VRRNVRLLKLSMGLSFKVICPSSVFQEVIQWGVAFQFSLLSVLGLSMYSCLPMNDQVRIEPAEEQDVAAIMEIHYAAVHQTARSFYPEEVINAWSPPMDNDRINRVKRAIENPDEWLIVAKQSNLIVGFGSIHFKDNQLRALYVHPGFGRSGIGARILTALEHEARSLGLPYLQMDASINAESFYRKHGFEIIEYATYQFASGQEMACVKMRKMLSSVVE
jgi:putative acetyltransferase